MAGDTLWVYLTTSPASGWLRLVAYGPAATSADKRAGTGWLDFLYLDATPRALTVAPVDGT